MTDDQLLELAKDAWGRDKLGEGRVDHRQFYVDFGRLVMKVEREACARVCEEHAAEIHGYDKHEYAAAIRARGE